MHYSTTHNINEVRIDKVSATSFRLAQVAKRAERAQLLVGFNIITVPPCTNTITLYIHIIS